MSLDIKKIREEALKKVGNSHTKETKNNVQFVKPWHDESIFNLEENSPKIDENKPDTNLTQTSPNPHVKTDTKVIPNQYQSNTKLIPQNTQTNTKLIPNYYQTDLKSDTTIDNKVIPNWYQSDTKTGFFSLTGLQKKIVIFIYNLCKISRDKKTDGISIAQISENCESTVKSTKTAINRLIKKNILFRESFKNGRGGWTVYLIPNNVYQEIITDTKLIPNWYQTSTKLTSELTSEVIPSSHSNSSIIYNNITTTEKEVVKEIGEEYKKIDFSSLEKIGFGITQISQLAELKIPPDLIQESINHFAFGLENSEKTKSYKEPLNVLMGTLRSGRMWTETNYKSPRQIGTEELAKYRKQEAEKMREIENKFFEQEFEFWYNKLTVEELKRLIPEVDIAYGKIGSNETLAIRFFRTTVFPKIIQEIKTQS